MFTSRAEHRLVLRQDNASIRMLPHSKRLGIISDNDIREVETVISETRDEIRRLSTTHCDGVSLLKVLRRPEASYSDLPESADILHPDAARQVEIHAKYEGYIQREQKQIAKADQLDRQRIPSNINYDEIRALRNESREKLNRVLPENLGQASRISGVNPADIAILAVWIKRIQAAPASR